MSRQDLANEHLLTGVKTLLACEKAHIQLNQTKLYTLFSIAFQHLIYSATQKPGHYILRIEDSYLLDKLTKKAKDPATRRSMQGLALPRRLKVKESTLHLDFFTLPSWANTNELPKDRIHGALIVRSAYPKPMGGLDTDDEQMLELMKSLPKDYPISVLSEFVPKTVVISVENQLDHYHPVRFDFIKEEANQKLARGVSVSHDINLDDLKD